jgi:hypothetical protein
LPIIVAHDYGFDFCTVTGLDLTSSPPLLPEQHWKECRGHSICFCGATDNDDCHSIWPYFVMRRTVGDDLKSGDGCMECVTGFEYPDLPSLHASQDRRIVLRVLDTAAIKIRSFGVVQILATDCGVSRGDFLWARFRTGSPGHIVLVIARGCTDCTDDVVETENNRNRTCLQAAGFVVASWLKVLIEQNNLCVPMYMTVCWVVRKDFSV